MVNLFQLLRNYINSQSEITYGDLINENNNINNEDRVKRFCTYDEYEEYKQKSIQDKKRFIDKNQHCVKDNYLMGKRQFNSVIDSIAGISNQGELKQIC